MSQRLSLINKRADKVLQYMPKVVTFSYKKFYILTNIKVSVMKTISKESPALCLQYASTEFQRKPSIYINLIKKIASIFLHVYNSIMHIIQKTYLNPNVSL